MGPGGQMVRNPNFGQQPSMATKLDAQGGLDPTKRAGKPAATPAYAAKVNAEVSRRAKVADIQNRPARWWTGSHNELKASMQATNDVAQTTEGRNAIDQLNRYNATLPPGHAEGGQPIIQKASDLAPKTAEVPLQPHLRTTCR